MINGVLMIDVDEFYMRQAIELAKRAFCEDEVPIGCVIVYNDTIIGSGYNLRNTKKNTLCHAEIIAIKKASVYLGDWRLEDCTLYVTVEPCAMCAGAMLQGRLTRLVFGAANLKGGAVGSVFNLFEIPGFNHKVLVSGGVLFEECSGLMSDFFRRFRG